VNQRKIILYIASSLDGYIATEDHNLDWLFSVEGAGDNSISKFLETIDTILLGRITYDWIMEYEKGEFPYKNKECYVFSKEKRNKTEFVTFIHTDIIEFIGRLKNKHGKNIWIVGGSELIKTFITEKLIDEMIITIAPVLIGKGIPLFRENNIKTKLILKHVNQYNQFIELHYTVDKG
jgi:dihydrofolate reductase